MGMLVGGLGYLIRIIAQSLLGQACPIHIIGIIRGRDIRWASVEH